MVDSNCKYIISINNIYSYILDSAAAAAPAAANYYDGIYGLGTAIGTNMPVIETDGACKYLHLGDGRKYEIDSTYSLKGYHLSDMTISPDAASFSANGVVSAYRLSYKMCIRDSIHSVFRWRISLLCRINWFIICFCFIGSTSISMKIYGKRKNIMR